MQECNLNMLMLKAVLSKQKPLQISIFWFGLIEVWFVQEQTLGSFIRIFMHRSLLFLFAFCEKKRWNFCANKRKANIKGNSRNISKGFWKIHFPTNSPWLPIFRVLPCLLSLAAVDLQSWLERKEHKNSRKSFIKHEKIIIPSFAVFVTFNDFKLIAWMFGVWCGFPSFLIYLEFYRNRIAIPRCQIVSEPFETQTAASIHATIIWKTTEMFVRIPRILERDRNQQSFNKASTKHSHLMGKPKLGANYKAIVLLQLWCKFLFRPMEERVTFLVYFQKARFIREYYFEVSNDLHFPPSWKCWECLA